MTQDVTQAAKELLAIVADSKRIAEIQDFQTLFTEAITVSSLMAFLISPVADAEQRYRRLVMSYQDEEMSAAGAENKAKASDEYKEWRKLEQVFKRGDEYIKLLKRFKNNLEDEYTRS